MTVDDQELRAVRAVMENDMLAACAIVDRLTPERLHELMRVCLVTAGLARDSILSCAGAADDPENGSLRAAYRAIDEMEKG